MNRSALYIAAVCIAMMSIVAACNTSGCLDNQNSIPLAGFYASSTGSAISVDSIEIGGVDAPHDSLLATGKATISELYLPLRSTHNSASFYLRYMQKNLARWDLADTIRFTYTSEPYFASEECGAMYRYRITSCTHTRYLIESVEIVDSLITNIDTERIKIYFRTSTPDEIE